MSREAGKIDRQLLTDVAKEYAEYIGPDGHASTQPRSVYRNLTMMIYSALGLSHLLRRPKTVGTSTRDKLDPKTLDMLAFAERTFAETLRRGMAQNLPRQEIKKNVKAVKEKLARFGNADPLTE